MRKFAGLALAGVILIAGCKGFWDPPTTTGGGGNGTASGVFYILNQQTSQLAGFTFAAGATSPSAVSGSPYSLAAAPQSLVLSPSGSYLYVGTLAGIYVYGVGNGGALSLLNNSQAIDSADLGTAMAVDSSGSWLLVATSGAGVLTAVPISSTTGLLDTARTVQTANLPVTTPQQIAVTPSGATDSYVFVALGTGGTSVLTFAPSAANPFSKVTTYQVKTTGGADNAIAVDPSDRLLYVGETLAASAPQTGGLRAFTIGANSALTEVSGSPYPSGGTGPSAILPTASFVYVANRAVSGSNNGNITGYPIATVGTTFSLGAVINSVSAGQVTLGLAIDSSKTFLLAVNAQGSPDLSTFTFDATTAGKLVVGPTAATGTDPVRASAIVAVP
jgi:6-phosphogluconolactonase (cycloisomerase 2 family)